MAFAISGDGLFISFLVFVFLRSLCRSGELTVDFDMDDEVELESGLGAMAVEVRDI